MDRTTRRRRLGTIAIAIAALACAATSATVPTPNLSSGEGGTLTVTADRPVAWVDVTADENAELIAANSQTAIRLTGTAPDPSVFLIAEEVGVAGSTSGRLGSTEWTAHCLAGARCGATVRLTAILVDPIGHPSVDVAFAATADAFFPSTTGPVPSASVAVDVGEIQTRSAAASGLASTEGEEIHLGPDMPRAVRTVHMSLPEGPPADPILLPNALVLMNEVGHGADFHPDVGIRIWANGEEMSVPWSAAATPFADCQIGAPCEADLELQFDWGGGRAEGSSVEWSLAAWPGVGADEPRAAATIDAPVSADVSWEGPVLASSVSGSKTMPKNRGEQIDLHAALDQSEVAQSEPDVSGLARLSVQATLAPGTDPAAEVVLSIDGSNDAATLTAGEAVTIYSRAVDVTCGGRTVCPADFSVRLGRNSIDLPEATVNWTASIEFLPLDAGLPEGAEVTVVVASPPP